MKKFEFKLQRLLDIRKAQEKEVQNELAQLVSVQNVERIKQDELRSGINKHQTDFQKKLRSGKASPEEAILFEKYVDISLRAISVAGDRISDMEPDINKVRARLIAASKEKKVVEKLKEKKKAEYDYDYNREIAKESDDMNQKIYLRKRAQ